MDETKVYTVGYLKGPLVGVLSFDSIIEDFVTIFATIDKNVADEYADRFNAIRSKWLNYYIDKYSYSPSGDKPTEFDWIDPAYEFTDVYQRWSRMRNISECYIEEIELRR